jgi:hypothetical protein
MATETSREVFNDLRLTTLEYGGKWRAYFQGVSEAYANAFRSQELLLQRIKGAVERRKKAEVDNIIFAFTMLTAGFGGLIATHFARDLKKFTISSFPEIAVARHGNDIIDDMVQSVLKGASLTKEAFNAQKPWTDRLKELGGATSSAPPLRDPFVPADATPAAYGARLLQGAEEHGNLMSDIARFLSAQSDYFPLDVAKNMRAAILRSAFFQQAPASKMTDETKAMLTARAKLGLWICWALERDKRYWEVQSALQLYGKSEIYEWEPLRQELVLLAVPATMITAKGFDAFGGLKFGMKMDAFIKWAQGPDSLHALFAGFKWGSEAFKWAKDKWDKKVMVHA